MSETSLHRDGPGQVSLQPFLHEEENEDILPPLRKRNRVWVMVLLVVLLVVLLGGVLFYVRRSSQSPVQYTQQAVNYGNIAVTASATGPIDPKAQYDLNFAASGVVSEIDVHVGQQVKAGQTLAKLNSTSLQDALTQAQQTLTSDQVSYNDALNSQSATLSQANAAIATATDTYNNSKQTQSDLDQLNQTKAQWAAQEQSAQASVDKAYQTLLSGQDAVTAAQHNLSNVLLTAPANTTVASINGTVGQTAGSGSSGSASGSTSQGFIVLVDTSAYTISAQVSEADIGKVRLGQPAQFTVPAYPSQTFRATVTSIQTIGQTSSNVVNYTVDLAVDAQSLQNATLYTGMTATVNITTAQRIGALLVNNSAFSFTTTALQAGALDRTTLASALGGSFTSGSGSSQGNRRIVLELKNNKLTPVLVTVGLTNGTSSEVLSGLQAGDQVVVSATGGAYSNLSGTSGTGGGNGTRSGGGGLRIPGGFGG
ncbi:MAG TPA: HlyD family efflux transporter periplasmic adaptor subunit [Ktedonobacteraceae bacterium]|nr:HlyD family efflux transporter periplasmic adaptor subunit [Ktedonobacteraceae bacterium]